MSEPAKALVPTFPRTFVYRMQGSGTVAITDAFLRSKGFVPVAEPIPEDWVIDMETPIEFAVTAVR